MSLTESSQSYTNEPNNPPGKALSEKHRRQLEEESGIAREVYEERGVCTITHGRQLPEGFSRRQRRRGAGILFTGHAPDGSKFYIFRPDRPDPKSPGRKYEMPAKACGGPGNRLDIHPSCRDLINRTGVPVIFVEGVKKADAILSAARAAGVEALVVAVMGVCNWMSDGEPILDMFEIPVEGRRVTILFDSDMLRNPKVQDGSDRLAKHHEGRGADVYMTYLPDQDDGSKNGADDFLANGGTLAEMRLLTRRYDPADFERVRLSRDEKLGAAVGYLWLRWREDNWMQFVGDAERPNWQRGHTARDTKEALNELAPRIGKLDERGIVIEVGLRRLAEMAAKSAPSVNSALKHLEADGQLEILPAEDKEKPRRYRLLVPRATLYSMERKAKEEGLSSDSPLGVKGCAPPTAPRLRWSSPGRKGHLVRHHEGATGRTVTDAVGERPYVKRLGPHRGAVVDVLEWSGAELAIHDLMEALHRPTSRRRDFKRRILRPLVKAEILEVGGDVVRLTADWREALEAERLDKGEIEQAERQRARYREESAAHRTHLEAARHGATRASIAAVRRSKALRERRLREMREEVERDRASTPPEIEALITRILAQHDRIRVGLLCEVAEDEGLRRRDVPPALERMGYHVERLPEHGDAEFVFAERGAA